MNVSKGKKRILLTGVTGLLGSYLTKVLLENDYLVCCLTRSQKDKTAIERVRDILAFWDKETLSKYSDNLIVLEGDITKKDLGFEQKTISMLQKETEEIFHCAAITKFNWPLDEIRKVNVDGTKNVFDFALQCKNVTKVNHISTAFICGNHNGTFTENDLDVGQSFNTTYEQSKFEAEKLVEEYRNKGLRVDVFRPPFVVGESKKGTTPVFQGFYQTLHLWSLEIFDIFPARGVNVNIITVDILAEAIVMLAHLALEENANYHPYDFRAIPLEEMLQIASERIGFRKPKSVSISDFQQVALTPIQRMILKDNISAFNPKVILDSTATDEILKKQGFAFPAINEQILFKILTYPFKVSFKNEKII
jgi:thioester reductase-like protein